MTLELHSRELGGSPLATLAVSGGAPAEWYDAVPRGDGWRRRVDDVASGFRDRAWLPVLAEALCASGAAAERLDRVASAGGIVVTTGQQPALFGGPLYTWFKALSALALAEELERRTGVAAAAVFWAATDDADFAEASETTVSLPGGAEVIRVEQPRGYDQTPLAEVPLGDVSAQLEALSRACGSAPNVAALDAARVAYDANATVGGAYVRLLRALLGPLGIAVLDAAHPAVRHAGAPVLTAALAHATHVEDALDRRSKALRDAGFRAQVAHVAGRTLVFTTGEDGRQRVRVRDAERALQSGVEGLSPNVLLRPVLERAILPTVAYVGGPAEIAYFAQVSAVADTLALPRPLIVPRWSGVLVEPHVRKLLEQIDADVEDFADPHAVETRVAREQLPGGVTQALERARAQVAAAMGDLRDADDSGVVPAPVIEGARRQLLHKLDRVERRYLAAIKRRGSELLTEVATARGALYPNGKPQERALNVIPFLAKYGDELFGAISAKAREHAARL